MTAGHTLVIRACGDALDGFAVTYTGIKDPVVHGTKPVEKDTRWLSLEDDETIVAISGRYGATVWGDRIIALSFTTFNESTGEMKVEGPYGGAGSGRSGGKAFRVSANGIFVAFGGYAINTDKSPACIRRHELAPGLPLTYITGAGDAQLETGPLARQQWAITCTECPSSGLANNCTLSKANDEGGPYCLFNASTMSSSAASTTVRRKYFPPADPSVPGIVVQTTVLPGNTVSSTSNSSNPHSSASGKTYMFFAAACMGAEEEEMERAVEGGRVARDWGCAMPAGGATRESTGTALFRSPGGGSDAAVGMACRLATRLQSQVFVALDVESRLVVLAEKRIVASLKEEE
ncbi:hypothetical protein B0H16DRAFT_1888816 [Mycena metata]|uniref:Jacalin-type lectin domain-containing protein n=1 Tax=Mycena metata TaxID=1033252 RepID=A0AAD7INR5_9AGAR|nr:hypothetical protein B0H16DRAFT_1888816 [Mycena metata]